MKTSSRFALIAVVCVSVLASSCGEKQKTTGQKGGAGQPPATESKMTTVRTESTRQLFFQLDQAKLQLESLANLEANFGACSEATARPGTSPFLVIDYFDCPITFTLRKDKIVTGYFSGAEQFSLSPDGKTVIITAENLELSLSGFGDSKDYYWTRKLILDISFDDLKKSLGKGIAFSLDQVIEPKSSSAKSYVWRTSLLGNAIFEADGDRLAVHGFGAGLRADNKYFRPHYIPVKKKWERVKGRLLMKSQTAITFSKKCGQPTGSFKWEFDDSEKNSGTLDVNDSGIVDPTGTDPVYSKPQPWGKCRKTNDLL